MISPSSAACVSHMRSFAIRPFRHPDWDNAENVRPNFNPAAARTWPDVNAACAFRKRPEHGGLRKCRSPIYRHSGLGRSNDFQVPIWQNCASASTSQARRRDRGSCIPARLSVATINVSETSGTDFRTSRTTGLSFSIQTWAISA